MTNRRFTIYPLSVLILLVLVAFAGCDIIEEEIAALDAEIAEEMSGPLTSGSLLPYYMDRKTRFILPARIFVDDPRYVSGFLIHEIDYEESKKEKLDCTIELLKERTIPGNEHENPAATILPIRHFQTDVIAAHGFAMIGLSMVDEKSGQYRLTVHHERLGTHSTEFAYMDNSDRDFLIAKQQRESQNSHAAGQNLMNEMMQEHLRNQIYTMQSQMLQNQFETSQEILSNSVVGNRNSEYR